MFESLVIGFAGRHLLTGGVSWAFTQPVDVGIPDPKGAWAFRSGTQYGYGSQNLSCHVDTMES
jgi:hypothetical protein